MYYIKCTRTRKVYLLCSTIPFVLPLLLCKCLFPYLAHTTLQALSKNGKVFGNGIMVGVQRCIDKVRNRVPPTHISSCLGNLLVSLLCISSCLGNLLMSFSCSYLSLVSLLSKGAPCRTAPLGPPGLPRPPLVDRDRPPSDPLQQHIKPPVPRTRLGLHCLPPPPPTPPPPILLRHFNLCLSLRLCRPIPILHRKAPVYFQRRLNTYLDGED